MDANAVTYDAAHRATSALEQAACSGALELSLPSVTADAVDLGPAPRSVVVASG